MNSLYTQIVLLTSLLFSAASVSAEATFITDKVKVDLYSLQNNKGVIVKSVTSGTPVKILKTEGEYHMIRTSDNKAGWVPTVSVMTEKPVQIEYLQLLAKYDELNKKVATNKDKRVDKKALDKQKKALVQARKNLNDSKNQIKQLEASLKTKDSEMNSSKTVIEQLKQQITQQKQKLAKAKTDIAAQSVAQTSLQPLQPTENSQPLTNPMTGGEFSVALRWFLIGMLITLVIGFMLGKRWVDDKIRKRHGGLRLY